MVDRRASEVDVNLTEDMRPVAEATERRAGRGFITLLALCQLGIWVAILTPAQTTVAVRVGQVAPGSKEETLGMILGVGVLFSLVGSPLFGRLSDRTATPLGRRRPWILGGLLSICVFSLVIATSDSVPMLLGAWCLCQLSGAAAYAALTATIPDKVPSAQRGTVSGVIGMMLPVGTLFGVYVVQLFDPSSVMIFAGPGLLGVLLGAVYVVFVRDTEPPREDLPKYGPREFARSFWVDPRRHPDFAWAFASRFLVYLGYAVLMAYQVYFLTDHLKVPQNEVTHLVFLVTLTMTVASILSAVAGGKLSDLAGRRKPFVFVSASVMAVGLVGIGMAGSFPEFWAMATLVGLGQGLFLSVDLALVSDVLPNPDDNAKDMGVFNIANTLPQSLAPLFAPLILAIGGGGNYPLLFLVGACFGLMGAIVIYRVRGTR
ncbi:MFS transporter [Streptomyces sp. ODS28]|uniref:MFS transporter n=1 Tax=Streptomyces sp. ODS28 TaxID=3136688 RepID=UPI0031E84936